MTDVKRYSDEEWEDLVEYNDFTIAEGEARRAISKPNYYAILPAIIRYDVNLSYFERILYGEITAMASKNGYCYATDEYFSRNFDISSKTVSRGIAKLSRIGYISLQVENKGYRDGKLRKIYINFDKMGAPVNRGQNTYAPDKSGVMQQTNEAQDKSENGGVPKPQNEQKRKDNNTSINNTSIIIYNKDDDNPSVVEQKPPTERDSLPDWLGKTSFDRVLKLYELMWEYKFSVRPKVITVYSTEARVISGLLKQYNEVMVALIIIMHFDWRGIDGMSEFEHTRIENAGYPLTWIPNNTQLYMSYIKNSLGVNTNADAIDHLDKALLLITTP